MSHSPNITKKGYWSNGQYPLFFLIAPLVAQFMQQEIGYIIKMVNFA